MKLLPLLALGASFLLTGLLFSQQIEKGHCGCRDCKCKTQTHCGCYSEKGCDCSTEEGHRGCSTGKWTGR
ncbi:MAG: hypothetical protein ACH350_02210 [Parachlamydiaceae bacterium]